MKKKTILIIIDNLKKGGAEVLLVGILSELNKKFDVILVTLSGECDFSKEQIICKKRYTLGFTGKLSFILCIFKLKRIIKLHNPSLIHSHLVYSTLIARMAGTSKTPLLFTVHNELSKNVFNDSKLLTTLEKLTFRKRHTIVAVSDTILKDYQQTIASTDKTFILKNYIADDFYSSVIQTKERNHFQKIRMVAVGNIKSSKNYEYLLRSLIGLDKSRISLDIYGNSDHPLFVVLQSLVEKNNLPVRFLGSVSNVRETLLNYDLYVMSSLHEGFGIAAVEAMACGIPLLLSDLPVLREVTFNNALFFDIKDPMALSGLISQILEDKYNLSQFSKNGREISKQYSKKQYLETLFTIYNEMLH
ncbi:MAG: glycosyltransferase [Ginsengibacter sp.]